MNIFSGARRLAVIGAGLILVGGITVALNQTPHAYVRYSVEKFGAVPKRVDKCRGDIEDGYKSQSRSTPSGTDYQMILCFHALDANGGGRLVPFARADDNHGYLVSSKYSEVVSTYMDSVAADFGPTNEEFAAAEAAYSADRWEKIGSGAGGTVLALFIYWALIWLTGWVARGFAGIPRGHDQKPT